MDSYGFLGTIYWLHKLVETVSNWFVIIGQKITDLNKSHGSENWKISIIVAKIMSQYIYEIIEAN